MSAKQSPTSEFVLVYDSKKPTSLHARTGKECWTGHMREATADELKELTGKRCKHCQKRVAQAEPADPEPARMPIARKAGAPVKATEKVEAAA